MSSSPDPSAPHGLRRRLHRFVPSHFQDPVGLARRLLGSRDPDAYAAMGQAALGLLLTPVDLALQAGEHRLYGAAGPPARPMLFVCGPPRSGTTLVAQTLMAHLQVAWLTNLMALFPRSPLRARQLFRPRVRPWTPTFRSYYGRSRSLAAPNDSLALWDRWLGRDRTRLREALTPAEQDAMVRFFGALEPITGRVLVTKNNNLNCQAGPVAAALPGARFLCLDRDPVFLGQALLTARRDIHGTDRVPYGLHPDFDPADDPVTSVCRQVRAHRAAAARWAAALGPSRFRVISYDRFCAEPASTIAMVADELLGLPAAERVPVPPGLRFEASRKVRLAPAEFAALERGLAGAADAGA